MAPWRKRAKKSLFASKDAVILKALVGMPMDIIFEIFANLDPLDLLQLARTTKALRAILMSRSSSSLWKRVRYAYYQMPDGPEGMSEPRYISLALEPICYGCGGSESVNRSVYIYWSAQLKCCRQCESALLVNLWGLKNYDPWLVRLLENNVVIHQHSLKQAQIWSQEYASLSGSSANLQSKLEWERQARVTESLTEEFRRIFVSWTYARDREMRAERSRLIEAINKGLLIKLEELGWGVEISNLHHSQRSDLYTAFSIHILGSFPQVWSSNGPAILKALKVIQTNRRHMLIQRIYGEYICRLPADALIPNIADVALSPPVHSVFANERTTNNFKITWWTFENLNLMQTLPSIVSDWKIRLDDELIRMVQVKLSEPFTKDQLLLATTVFYCDACDMDLFYPQVLVHQCSPYRLDSVERSTAWNSSGNIKFDRNVHQAAIDIIDILGLDPKVVTAKNMTIRNSILQCLECRKTRQGRMTMIWSRAMEHSRKEHNCLPSMISWKVPGHNGQLTLQASLAKELATSDRLDLVPRFMCGVCKQKLKETLTGLKHHLLAVHRIRKPGKHDIFFHPDAIHAPMPCVLPETD